MVAFYTQRYCIISDCTKHTAVTVHAFLRRLVPLPAIMNRVLGFKMIPYFSDGCRGQYKNKFNFANVCSHDDDFRFPANGIFRNLPRQKSLWRDRWQSSTQVTESLRRTVSDQLFTTQNMYASLSQQFVSTLKFMFVVKKEVSKAATDLTARFAKARTAKGTKQ